MEAVAIKGAIDLASISTTASLGELLAGTALTAGEVSSVGGPVVAGVVVAGAVVGALGTFALN